MKQQGDGADWYINSVMSPVREKLKGKASGIPVI
jgi:hypothetical protein